jgi:drug/metabolite transporter (DMT)-like permease
MAVAAPAPPVGWPICTLRGKLRAGERAAARSACAEPGLERSLTHRSERLGLLFAALCAGNGAFVPAISKLTTDRADPIFVAAASSLVAALAAAVVLAARGELAALVEPRRVGSLMLLGSLGTGLAFVCFFEGVSRTSAIETALCLQIEPLYSLLIARFFLGHPLARRRVVGVALLLAGIALAVGLEGFRGSPGVLLLLATPLCWQASHLLVLKRLSGLAPPLLTGARYVFGSAVLCLYWALRAGPATIPAPAVLAPLAPVLAIQGLISFYFGTSVWYAAIARLDLARTTAIVVPSIPILSLGASFLLLGEVASPREWAGLLLCVGGVSIFVTAPHAARPLGLESAA